MTVLIIEDEPRAARELSNILSSIDNTIEVLAVLNSVSTSLQWLEQNTHPDLILSDIQLADGLCFDIYTKIVVTSPIIFCTAFDEYLLDAFESNAISYLLKPITKEKVEKALDKFQRLKSIFEKGVPATGIEKLLRQLKYHYKSALLVNLKDKIIPILVKDIAFLYLDKTIVNITTQTNERFVVSSSLDELEKMLDPSIFFRANRQFLINRSTVTGAERYFARKLVAKLTVSTPETIIVSKAKATEFLQWLQSGHQ